MGDLEWFCSQQACSGKLHSIGLVICDPSCDLRNSRFKLTTSRTQTIQSCFRIHSKLTRNEIMQMQNHASLFSCVASGCLCVVAWHSSMFVHHTLHSFTGQSDVQTRTRRPDNRLTLWMGQLVCSHTAQLPSRPASSDCAPSR